VSVTVLVSYGTVLVLLYRCLTSVPFRRVSVLISHSSVCLALCRCIKVAIGLRAVRVQSHVPHDAFRAAVAIRRRVALQTLCSAEFHRCSFLDWSEQTIAAYEVNNVQSLSSFTAEVVHIDSSVNPLMGTGNYSVPHELWPLMNGLLHLLQRGEYTGYGRSPPRPFFTNCNSPPVNGQCTNHRIAV